MRKVMLLLAMAMMSFSQLSAQESAVDDHGINDSEVYPQKRLDPASGIQPAL